jgi:hypothetical protein
MPFDVLETLSLAGDPLKPNDDAFGHVERAAVVLDGATSLGDPLMPGDSDAAWIAHFGARRLMAHVRDGDSPEDALRHTFGDAKKSFEALRRHEPQEPWQIPFASMAFAYEAKNGFEFLWYGDCAGLLLRPGGQVEVLGDSFKSKQKEAAGAARAAKALNRAPVASGSLTPYLAQLRQQRNHINSGKSWAFSPDPRAADHVQRVPVAAPPGSLLLLASDGFLALATDYDRYSPHTLMERAASRGLAALGEELREIEDADPQGHKYPRFKKCDDATALLLKLA